MSRDTHPAAAIPAPSLGMSPRFTVRRPTTWPSLPKDEGFCPMLIRQSYCNLPRRAYAGGSRPANRPRHPRARQPGAGGARVRGWSADADTAPGCVGGSTAQSTLRTQSPGGLATNLGRALLAEADDILYRLERLDRHL